MSTFATPLDFFQQAGPDDFLQEIVKLDRKSMDPDDYLACIHGDFRFFLWELWRDRELHRFAPLDRGELDIANYASTGPKKRGVLAPRGVGKTNFGTAAMTCFRLRRDRNRRVLIPSKSEGAMKEVISFAKGWINSVWFLQDLDNQDGRALRADGENCRDTTLAFDVSGCLGNKQPSVKAIGNEGMLEGNRAHSIFPDDVETKTNSKTLDGRANLFFIVKEYVNILYPDLPYQEDPDNELLRPVDPTEVCYFGTVKHEETVYAKLDAMKSESGKKSYSFRTWTLAYPNSDEIRGALNLSPMLIDDITIGRAKAGDPVFPKRFGTENIEEKKAEGYTEWSLEHQQQVVLAKTNRYPLRLSDLIIMDVDRDVGPATVVYGTRDNAGSTAIQDIPCLSVTAQDALYRPVMVSKPEDWHPYHGTYAFIDPAGRGADETGISIVAAIGSLLFVKCCTGVAGGHSPDAFTKLILLCKQHRATNIWIEGNVDTFGTYIQTFESMLPAHFEEPGVAYPKGWKASVEEHRSTGMKEERICETLEPVTSTHRLIIDRRVITQQPDESAEQTIQYQLSRMRKERNCIKLNDRVDSLANCVHKWNHILRNDMGQASQRLSEQAQIEAHIAKAKKFFQRMDEPIQGEPAPSFLSR